MATEVIMPKVDMDMTEGKIAYWYVKSGDQVKKGQPLFDIETDKATMEVECPADGAIHVLTEAIGEAIQVGTPVAWVLAQGETSSSIPGLAVAESTIALSPVEVDSTESVKTTQIEENHEASPDRAVSTQKSRTTLLRATPLARALARKGGIDLSSVSGTGPQGRIYSSDLPAQTQQLEEDELNVPLFVNWIVKGEGTPLVMIHGFGADQGGWRPLSQKLPNVPIVGVDLPNHGKSPRIAVRSLGEVAIRVIHALDQFGVEDFHLVGHSMGAAVSVEVASIVANRVVSLTLLSPAGLGPEINGAFIEGLCRANSEASLRPWLAELLFDEQYLSSSFLATAFKQLESQEKRAALKRMAELLLPDGTQAENQRVVLQHLNMPTRVLWGDSDKIIPASHAKGLPDAVGLHLLKRVGHLPHVEAADVVAQVLQQQLKQR